MKLIKDSYRMTRFNKFSVTMVSVLVILFSTATVVLAGTSVIHYAGIADIFTDWGSLLNTLLALLSGFFGWFFKNLKSALIETRDVVNVMSTTVQEAVEVVDAFVNVIQISEDGTVSIPPDAFTIVKKELADVKTAASAFSKEMDEMAGAWKSLFKKPSK